MQRYNMFLQVHKGLRALLYETALQIQHTDFWDIGQAETTISKIRKAILLFEKHAASEDEFIFPAVQKYEPSVADAFEKEHVKDHELGEELQAALAAYEAAPVIKAKAALCRDIQNAFINFMVFNLEHMGKEEALLNEILWRYYSDDELLAFSKAIVANLSPDTMMQYSEFMFKGLNVPEVTKWLNEVKQGAPVSVFNALFGVAQQVVSAERLNLVLAGLTHELVVA